jgi:hypothetical protein
MNEDFGDRILGERKRDREREIQPYSELCGL